MGRNAEPLGFLVLRLRMQSRLAVYFWEGSRALLEWALTRTISGLRKQATHKGDQRLPVAMMIGAYGGDHIGDAAILGGVLFRIHARHDPSGAVLMSQATRPWGAPDGMLDTPVGRNRRQEYLEGQRGSPGGVC